MPIVHARTAEAIEEERRLLYVAVTRARVHLALSWSAARGTPGAGTSVSPASVSPASGSPASRQRSRFLAAMQAPVMAAGR
jgi:DNA helicase-2/ATP-dependent DNA helicase PcrA